jgi:hypothetical protein
LDIDENIINAQEFYQRLYDELLALFNLGDELGINKASV